MKQITVVFTGGHVTPSLAVVEAMKEKHVSWNIVWFGRMHAMEGERSVSQEYTMVKAFHIPFYPIITGRFQRSLSLYTIFSLLKIPVGFFQALFLLCKLKPHIIVSFGRYIALPVAFAGYILGIPIITHEQTLVPGLANRWIARVAKKICVSYEETKRFFPKGNVVVTGLPIRKGIFTPPKDPSFFIENSQKLSMLFVTGGSTGAESINKIIWKALPELLNDFVIVHQTGSYSFAEGERMKKTLPSDKAKRYSIAPFFSLPDLSYIYNHASLIIGRSGANTVAEVQALGIPALFIPLPWAAGNEQEENAKMLVTMGQADILEQQSCTSEMLIEAIHAIFRKKRMKKRINELSVILPANNILSEIETVLAV